MPHVPHRHEHSLAHFMWGMCASVVLLFIFLAALGAFKPTEVVEFTIAVIALAGLWLAHEWRGLFRDERR